VRPIHLNFLFLISKFISSCPVTFRRSLLEIIFGHHILNIYLRHLSIHKGLYFTLNFVCDKSSFTSIQKYRFHTGIKYPNLSLVVKLLLLHSVNYKPTNAKFPSINDLRLNFQIKLVLTPKI